MNSISIEESTFPAAKSEILGLLNQGDRQFDAKFMKWRYEDRPKGYLVMCIAQTSEGKIVGCRAMFPFVFRVGGHVETFGIQADLFVNKEFREFGLGGRLVKFCIEKTMAKGVETIIGMPNQVSTKIQKKDVLRELGVVQGYRRYFDFGYRLSKKVSNVDLLNLLTKISAIPLGFLCPEERINWSKEFRLVHENSIGQEFDTLWDEVSKNVDIIGNRSSDYLRWRYLNHPYKHYEILKLVKGTEMVGYAICQRKDGARFVVDDILSKPSSQIRDSLIAQMLIFIKHTGASEVEVGVSEKNVFINHLKKFKFKPCADKWPFLVYSKPKRPESFYDIARWHITFGDKDM